MQPLASRTKVLAAGGHPAGGGGRVRGGDPAGGGDPNFAGGRRDPNVAGGGDPARGRGRSLGFFALDDVPPGRAQPARLDLGDVWDERGGK